MIGSTRPQRIVVAAMVCAAAFAAGGIAYAAIPDSSGIIHGCYNTGSNPSGQLRVIDAASGGKCSKNESALNWNQQGPTGPQGPVGPQGPKGDPGPTYSAGTGLDLSNNTFGIQGSYQLPQGCTNGQSPFLQNVFPSHPWGCFTAANADMSCPANEFQNGVNANGDPTCATPSSGSAGPGLWFDRELGDQDTPLNIDTALATVSLPAGSFLLNADGWALADADGSDVALDCTFAPGGGVETFATSTTGLRTFSLSDVVTLASPGDVTLSCVSRAAHTHANNVIMTALQVGTVH